MVVCERPTVCSQHTIDDRESDRCQVSAELVQSSSSSHVSDKTAPSVPYVTLPNGLHMPMLGLGTTHSGGYYHETVVYALKEAGYRLIDTAKRYGVEKEIGQAIEDSGMQRSDLFLTSKLWPVDFGNTTENACQNSCRRLGTDYLDLYVIHFPEMPRWFDQPRLVKEETWRHMERLYENGKCRAIGVSNYDQKDLEELLEFCSIKPHVNQYEHHPYYNPVSLKQFCQRHNILFTGYCPLGKGSILELEPIKRLASKHDKSAAQICIRWSLEQGVCAIPKSRQPYRVLENISVFDFRLDMEDMQSLQCLHDEQRKCVRLEHLQHKFALPDGYKLTDDIHP